MATQSVPQEAPCPISDRLLGDLYRADPKGLQTLVQTIPVSVRAMLAIYCYPRAHLNSMAVAIAASCEKDDLINFGGDVGAALFEQARRAPKAHVEKGRKISLASGSILQVVIDQDLI